MPVSYTALFSAIIVISIVIICFWKPNFPKLLLAKFGLQNAKLEAPFLLFFWISIPIIIYHLMVMIWQS